MTPNFIITFTVCLILQFETVIKARVHTLAFHLIGCKEPFTSIIWDASLRIGRRIRRDYTELTGSCLPYHWKRQRACFVIVFVVKRLCWNALTPLLALFTAGFMKTLSPKFIACQETKTRTGSWWQITCYTFHLLGGWERSIYNSR